jgi:hypothetical protein
MQDRQALAGHVGRYRVDQHCCCVHERKRAQAEQDAPKVAVHAASDEAATAQPHQLEHQYTAGSSPFALGLLLLLGLHDSSCCCWGCPRSQLDLHTPPRLACTHHTRAAANMIDDRATCGVFTLQHSQKSREGV